ncbi:MAG: phosphoglycerate dehydrogenase-like enzyme [Alcanivorax sp.]|jgi:phosphoglycerate dehydrogenase-like enzyme
MKLSIWMAGLLASACLSTQIAAAEIPPATMAIIEDLQLRSAEVGMSKHPQWQPQKVVVALPPQISAMMPDYESALQAVAGNVELVFDRSGGFTISPELLVGADGIIGVCNAPNMAAADDRLIWLHSYFAGMDSCQGFSDAQKEIIVFSNSKRLSGPTIAEHSIAMLMAITRGLPAFGRAQNEKRWDNELSASVRFGDLSEKTMLIAGLGGIGTEIARRAHGLGMRVIATRNSSRTGPDYVDYIGLADELPKLAKEADVMVNALPLTRSTTALFDQQFFDASKPGAIFISVGRGRSTVTADLISALESGQLYGAGLDVTDPEPLPVDSPLWQMENVIITPHSSGAGIDGMRRLTTIAVENLRRYVAGEPLLNLVDINKGY